MKAHSLAISALIALSPSFASAADQCLANAYTQAQMNQCSATSFEAADRELNRVYKEIRRLYKDDPALLKQLKKAQLAWIKLRDADLLLEYPELNDPQGAGSAFGMCIGMFKTQQTLQRVEFLKRWLKGSEEGDVCAGSQKFEFDLHGG